MARSRSGDHNLMMKESACTANTDTLILSRNRRNDNGATEPTLPVAGQLYVSRAEAGGMLGVNPRTIERLELDGELTAHRFGRCVRYKRSDVEAWAEGQAR